MAQRSRIGATICSGQSPRYLSGFVLRSVWEAPIRKRPRRSEHIASPRPLCRLTPEGRPVPTVVFPDTFLVQTERQRTSIPKERKRVGDCQEIAMTFWLEAEHLGQPLALIGVITWIITALSNCSSGKGRIILLRRKLLSFVVRLHHKNETLLNRISAAGTHQ